MEVNTATTVVASTATERDLIHPSGFNQDSHPIIDVVGQGGETVANQMGLIMSRSRVSLLFHHTVCLPIIRHLLLYKLMVRISVIPHPYSLWINNPSPIILMPMSLNLWRTHMKLPKTTLWPISGFIRDIPLKGLYFLASSCQMLWWALSIDHHHNPYILWWKDDLLL